MDLGLTPKSHGPPSTSKSQYDPLYPSRLTGGQRGQGHGVVLHVQEEGYQF